MALTLAYAQGEIAKLTDPENAEFLGYPATRALAADNWRAVCRSYFEGMEVPPGLALLPEETLEEIHDEADSACEVAFADFLPDALTQIPLGFQAYANALALGLATAINLAYPSPTGPAVCTAPPTPFVLPTAVTSDGAAVAAAIATVVDAWAKTGLYIPPHVTPPGPPPAVPWF